MESKHDVTQGQASKAKMMSLGVKLTAYACHLPKYANKAQLQTYLSTNIESVLNEENAVVATAFTS
jgi:hypothetical protein